jgi:hypothetical protein
MDIYALADFLLIASCGLLVTTIGFAVAWVRARERLLKFRAETVQMRDGARAERVDQAVDAIAVEVERIGEQQRFLTKILTENAPSMAARRSVVEPAPPTSPPRMITPH